MQVRSGLQLQVFNVAVKMSNQVWNANQIQAREQTRFDSLILIGDAKAAATAAERFRMENFARANFAHKNISIPFVTPLLASSSGFLASRIHTTALRDAIKRS